jgi:hypothetical protein
MFARKYLRQLIVIVLVVIAANIVYAQSDSTSQLITKYPTNSIGKGAWVLNFKIGSLSESNGDDKLVISGSRFLSDKYLLSLAFDTYADVGNLSQTSINQRSDTTLSDKNKLDNIYDRQNLRLSFLYIKYQTLKNKISLFWGLGPNISVDYFYSRTNYQNPPYQNKQRFIRKAYGFGAGLTGRLGAEWFATRKLSIFGEYVALAEYHREYRRENRSSQDPDYMYKNNYDINEFYLDLQDVLFGFAFYF